MTSRQSRVITIAVLVIASLIIVLVFAFARHGSVWYSLPFVLGPFVGMTCILSFVVEISRARVLFLPPQLRPRVSFAFFVIVVSYVVVALIFVASYFAALRMDGQLVSAERDYTCLAKLDYGSFRQFGIILYYSLVTASTLGYGDWVPRGVTARVLVFFEVVEFWALVLVSFTYFQLIANELWKRVERQLATQGAKPPRLYE